MDYFYGALPETNSALQSFIFKNEIGVAGFTPDGLLTELIDVPDVIPFFKLEIVGQSNSFFNWVFYTDGDRFISPNLDCPPTKSLIQAILYQIGQNPDCYNEYKLWRVNYVKAPTGRQIAIRPWTRSKFSAVI